MARNARQHPREEVTLRVDYMDAQGCGGLGLVTNLSYTGIALRSLSHPLQAGDTLILTFVTASGNACKLHARVVHTQKTTAGLVFTNVQEAYRPLRGAISAAFEDIPGDEPI